MRKMLHVSSVVGLLVFPTLAGAGPFGVDYEGFTLDGYGCVAHKGNIYTCDKIPSPHPSIETYVVKFVDGVGLCMVKGVSLDVADSIYGGNIRSSFDEIVKQVSVKYGSGDTLDFLKPGSIWDQPEDWMMGLLKNERYYAHVWKLNTEIDGVKEIYGSAAATKTDNGYFTLEFYGENETKCNDAETNSGASSF